MTISHAGTASPPEHAIELLSKLEPDRHWIVSCYLSLDRGARFRRSYLVDLKNRMRTARKGLPALENDVLTGIERDLDRISRAIDDPARLPGTPGVALFACHALDLFLKVPLPRVRRPRVIIDHVPSLREIRAAEKEFGRVRVAVLDRVRARIFDIDTRGAVELPEVPHSATRGGRFHSDRGDSPGSGEKEYHNRIRHEREQLYGHVIERLTHLDRERRADGLVIAGSRREIGGLAGRLDAELKTRVIGIARLNAADVTTAEVQRVAFTLFEQSRRDAELAELRAFSEALERGRATNGVRATVEALERGHLHTLLVRAETEAAEADAAVELAFESGVPVITVHDSDFDSPLNNLGGMLR